jgi:hypothetical protein
MWRTVSGVLLEPTATFRDASRTAGIGPALFFGLILGVTGKYISLVWDYLWQEVFQNSTDFSQFLPPEVLDTFDPSQMMAFSLVAGIFMAPIGVLVGLFLWSAIVHLLLLLFSGATHGFEATFRTIAYASGSTALFQAVPICGSFIGFFWNLVAQIIGLKEIHGISTGKAVAAVLLPLFLCCCAAIALIVGLMTMFASSAGGF